MSYHSLKHGFVVVFRSWNNALPYHYDLAIPCFLQTKSTPLGASVSTHIIITHQMTIKSQNVHNTTSNNTKKYKFPTTTITYGSRSSLPAMMVRGAIPMSRWTVIAPDRVGALTGTLTGIVRPAGGLAMPSRPARRDLTDLGVTESLVRHVLRVCR